MTYIQNGNKIEGCALCLELEKPDSPENLIVYRGQRVFLILNRYPYTSGHLMVAPFAHVPSIEQLDAEIRSEMMEVTTKGLAVLRCEYHPQGFNVGINLGESAGAGITEHVHMHIVPRWTGDTNFMTAVGGTRVLPEELKQTYERIYQCWSEMK